MSKQQFRYEGEKRPFAVQWAIQRASRFHSPGTDRRPASIFILAGRQFISRSPGTALLSSRRRLAHGHYRLLQQGKSNNNFRSEKKKSAHFDAVFLKILFFRRSF
jgi:hypothetical protein